MGTLIDVIQECCPFMVTGFNIITTIGLVYFIWLGIKWLIRWTY